MSKETNYRINLFYRLRDEASKGLASMAQNAKQAESSFAGLRNAAATYFGGKALYSSLIGFNSTVEDTKNQIAGMFALTKKTDLSSELANADKLFGNLQQRASSLPGTTQEYAKFAAMVTRSVTDSGLGMKELEDITVSAVVAAKAFGESAEVAARDVDQLLSGRFSSTDPFSGKLLGSMGFSGEDGREKVRKMSKADRADLLKRALAQKQISQLAKAQGASFGGLASTVIDAGQQFGGKVGAKLFEAAKKGLEDLTRWMSLNQAKIDAFASRLADGLATGFGAVKDAIAFMVKHSDLLISVGKVWLAAAAASKLGGMIGSGLGKGAGLIGALGTNVGLRTVMERDGATGQFTGKASSMGILGAGKAALGAGLAGWEIGTWLTENSKSVSGFQDVLNATFGDGAMGQYKKNLREIAALEKWNSDNDEARLRRKEEAGKLNLFGGDDAKQQQWANLQGTIDQDKIALNVANDKLRANLAKEKDGMTGGIAAMVNAEANTKLRAEIEKLSTSIDANSSKSILLQGAMSSLYNTFAPLFSEVFSEVLSPFMSLYSGFVGGNSEVTKPETKITINRIEVKTNDPDQLVFGLEEVARRSAQSRAVRRRF